MAYIKRWAETEYQLAETIFKAIIFTGVRQCGKTTLLKESLPTDTKAKEKYRGKQNEGKTG